MAFNDSQHSVRQISKPINQQEWVQKQLGTHLLFGPLQRNGRVPPLLLLGGVSAILVLIGHIRTNRLPAGATIDALFPVIMFLFLLKRISNNQQIFLAWLAVKITGGVVSLVFLSIAPIVTYVQGHSDWWVFVCLGLLWLPALEFIPKITPYQRYLTVARILLTIPCVRAGYRSGNWY